MSRIQMESVDEDSAELGREVARCMSILTRDENKALPLNADIPDMATCSAGSEEVAFERFPMKPALIAKEQRKDKKIRKNFNSNKTEFRLRRVEDIDLLTHQGKDVILDSLQGRVAAWYHKDLAHPGQTRMEATKKALYTWPGMKSPR